MVSGSGFRMLRVSVRQAKQHEEPDAWEMA
jgi:hypothetical protein